MLIPLAMAQFIASYDTSSMNVAISKIVEDLNTTVVGVQTIITIFTLTMAALMIPGSKLSDIVGRKKCFIWGIVIYGCGALITSLSPVLGVMFLGFSLLEGIGSALMIPPIYMITTVSFPDIRSRAKAFAIISAMAGLGSASGPLIGGFITTTLTWRVSFAMEVLVVILIMFLSKNIIENKHEGDSSGLDIVGAVLSGAGLVSIVIGLLLAGDYGWIWSRQDFMIGERVILKEGQLSPVIVFITIGLLLLLWFAFHLFSWEKKGKNPLLSSRLFRNRTSVLGLITQNIQWLIMIGSFFLTSVFLQVSRELSAIETGIVLTSATIGLLLSSSRAGALAKKFQQRSIISSGFAVTILGMFLILLLVRNTSSLFTFVPGLFLIGVGVGLMVTASVNVVQSSVPEKDQGEISGLSRSVSNLGSSLGTAISGAVLISFLISGVTSKTESSELLNSEQKKDVIAAMHGDVTTLSDTQVRELIKGQPPEVEAETVRINAESRNYALARAQMVMMIFGVLGLIAALLLPVEFKKSVARNGT